MLQLNSNSAALLARTLRIEYVRMTFKTHPTNCVIVAC